MDQGLRLGSAEAHELCAHSPKLVPTLMNLRTFCRDLWVAYSSSLPCLADTLSAPVPLPALRTDCRDPCLADTLSHFLPCRQLVTTLRTCGRIVAFSGWPTAPVVLWLALRTTRRDLGASSALHAERPQETPGAVVSGLASRLGSAEAHGLARDQRSLVRSVYLHAQSPSSSEPSHGPG
jgi:hypothetical protein